MLEEDISQEFRLKKKIEVTNNYFIKEINQNELLSNKKKKVCTTLTYIGHFLTLVLLLQYVFLFLLLLLQLIFLRESRVLK